MGYYIPGPTVGKGAYLEKEYDARPCSPSLALVALDHPALVPVCVVSNVDFEAAAVVYNDVEFAWFTDPEDARPKQWYVMDRTKAYELSGFKA